VGRGAIRAPPLFLEENQMKIMRTPAQEIAANRCSSIRRIAMLNFWQQHPLPELGNDIEVSYASWGWRPWSRRHGPMLPYLMLSYIGSARSAEEAANTLINVQYLLRAIFDHPTAKSAMFDAWEFEYAKRFAYPLSVYGGEGRLGRYRIYVQLNVPWVASGCQLEKVTIPARTVTKATCQVAA
jgi:hypothetical protein